MQVIMQDISQVYLHKLQGKTEQFKSYLCFCDVIYINLALRGLDKMAAILRRHIQMHFSDWKALKSNMFSSFN